MEGLHTTPEPPSLVCQARPPRGSHARPLDVQVSKVANTICDVEDDDAYPMNSGWRTIKPLQSHRQWCAMQGRREAATLGRCTSESARSQIPFAMMKSYAYPMDSGWRAIKPPQGHRPSPPPSPRKRAWSAEDARTPGTANTVSIAALQEHADEHCNGCEWYLPRNPEW